MKFVDEAIIRVESGKGGDGGLSFRREKNIAKGGPDGGDGGDGGSIYLEVDPGINTLVDFRYKRNHHAQNGQQGMGKDRFGKKGDDLIIKVPQGTIVRDHETGELIADLSQAHQRLIVARGGQHGLGNAHFKSSTNRTPRRITYGQQSESRQLYLELKLLADVGLLGLPNAGKSSLIRAVSAAKPRVADYPFTTLHPHLGVVRVGTDQSFVIADIPGLIKGAAQGVGLGVKFLKHLSRTRILLHMIDIGSDQQADPVSAVQQVADELKAFDKQLAQKERWLILNKIDFLPEDQRQAVCQAVIKGLDWHGPVFMVSAISKEGLKPLCLELMNYLRKTTKTS